jgi:hypothetical protein
MGMPNVPEPRFDPTSDASPARLSRCFPDYAFGSWANVFMISWRQETTVSAVVQVRKECERFGRLHPDGIFLLTIIEAEASVPSAAARTTLAAFLKAGNYILASAVVIEGHSFRAALVRGVVTGLTLLARQPFPHQVCSMGAAGQLFEKVSQATEATFSRSAFAIGVGQLRAQIERSAR